MNYKLSKLSVGAIWVMSIKYIVNFIYCHIIKSDMSDRFELTDQTGWKTHLKLHGYVVVASCISKKDCQDALKRMWELMEILSLGRLKKDDPSTQVLSQSYPTVIHGGMIQYVGQSQVQWDLRKKCKKVFELLWGTQDLKCSFDGFCFMNGKRNYKPKPDISFLHTDQSPLRKSLWSYQGFINLVDNVDDESGGLVVIPDSHDYHAEYFRQKNLIGHKLDFYVFPEEHKKSEKFQKSRKIKCFAGDFVLWDSKTFHCNQVPTKDELRVVVYICMLPSKMVTETIQKKREKAVEQGRTTNHHPGDGFRLFPPTPRFVSCDRDEFLKAIEQVNKFKKDKEIDKLI